MSTNRFNEIDFLRALACAMVVVFHYAYRGHMGGWIPQAMPDLVQAVAKFGYVGVHLFFAISGFVIFMSAKNATPRSFVASRVARLYPAYWVAIFVTVLAVRFGNMSTLTVSWNDVALNLTMLTHLFGAEYVDGAYWSLAIELHFYAFIFLLIKMNWLKHIEIAISIWLSLAVVDLIRPIYPLEFWLLANWAPFFCLGICSYLLRTAPPTRQRIALFLVSGMLSVAVGVKKANAAPISEQIIVATLMVSIVAIFALVASGKIKMQASPPLHWAGALTYPVYLIHEYLGYTLLTHSQNASWPTWLSVASTLAVVFILSYFVHTRVERVYSPKLRRIVQGE